MGDRPGLGDRIDMDPWGEIEIIELYDKYGDETSDPAEAVSFVAEAVGFEDTMVFCGPCDVLEKPTLH